jgi:hypothetical protein
VVYEGLWASLAKVKSYEAIKAEPDQSRERVSMSAASRIEQEQVLSRD